MPQHMWGCAWERDGFPLAAGFLLQSWGCAEGGTAGPSTSQAGRLGHPQLHSAVGSVFLLGRGALRANPMISCKWSRAGIVLCWSVAGGQEARRHPAGTRGTSPPKQPAGDAQASCEMPTWHPSTLLRSLRFSLRPALAYTICL